MPRCGKRQRFTEEEQEFVDMFLEWCVSPIIQERGYMVILVDELSIASRTPGFKAKFVAVKDKHGKHYRVYWKG